MIINSILPSLADPSNVYNSQHVYILQALYDSQSILLLPDVDSPEELINALFTNSFDIFAESASGREVEISGYVEYQLKNLLALVLDEVDVSHELTDIIISQFMRVAVKKSQDTAAKNRKSEAQELGQSTLATKTYPVAYEIAKSLCTSCQDKMTGQITNYFNAIIVDAGNVTNTNTASSNKRALGVNLTGEDNPFGDLRKAHGLLRELWRACPEVIGNVIPQIDAELHADSVDLRRLATETLGDLTAGIGIAGFAPSAGIDPLAYPQPSIERDEPEPNQLNPMLTPASPKPFITVHRAAYQSFLSRCNDRAPVVREAWVEAASRILLTRAGGCGLSSEEQTELLSGYAQTLRDPDEHVRLAAIRALKKFNYHSTVNILGADGGLAKPDTVFSTLAQRIPDRKVNVRDEAISLTAKVWGAASFDIQQGNEIVQSAVGGFASRLLNAYYIKDEQLHQTLERILFESLLPISFPSTKGSQTGKRKSKAPDETDPNAIRALRMLTLVNSLEEKPRRVLLGMQGRQAQISRGVQAFLDVCEQYNGGVIEDAESEPDIRSKLTSCIDGLSKPFFDASKVSSDLWKFAKQNDRRNYQLIKYAISAENDYKNMSNAVKELGKRIRDGAHSVQPIFESLQLLIYRSAVIMYNRSHVPTIMDTSRTDECGLGATAHEILREISSKKPEVLKSHVSALCAELEQTAPSATQFEEPSAADTLKACAQYAQKYPHEVSRDRKFLNALTNFALFSKSPRAAKHAVTIILAVADRKEMYAKEILSKVLKDFRFGLSNSLCRLAALAQICRYAPDVAAVEVDAINRIILDELLHQSRSTSTSQDAAAWDVEPDEETLAKELALKVLANQCRPATVADREESTSLTETNYNTLFSLVDHEADLTTTKTTPPAQRNRLRLAAARLILKLCTSKQAGFEALTTPVRFNTLAWIVIHPPNEVRKGFVEQIRKYHSQARLPHRWLTILFLLAFEPDDELRSSAIHFLKARTAVLTRQQQAGKSEDGQSANTMELLFARLLSLLAHHPDYPPPDEKVFDAELIEFSKYIVFYLVSVANEENVSLIFHVAQRIKQMRDNIEPDEEQNDRLYVLSDLAQAVIRNFADVMPHTKGANVLQTWPGKIKLHNSLFRPMSSHSEAQQVAEKNYLPEDTALELAKFMKDSIKQFKGVKSTRRPSQAVTDKKRKSDSVEPDELTEKPRKKKKTGGLPTRKRSTVKAARKDSDVTGAKTPAPSRKSARTSNAVSYMEGDSEEEEDETMDDAPASSSPAIPRRNGRHRASSPVQEAETHPAVGKQNGDDEEEETGDAEEALNIHEDDDADEDLESDDDADRVVTPSPSPLKERENTPGPPSPKKQGKQKSRATKARGAKHATFDGAASAQTTPASSGRKSSTSVKKSAPNPVSTKNKRTSVGGGSSKTTEETQDVENTRATRASRRSRG